MALIRTRNALSWLAMSVFVVLLTGAVSQAQDPGGDRGRRGDRRDRGGDRGTEGEPDRGGDRGPRGDWGRGFGRGGPPSFDFTPEQRDEFYNRMADWQLRRLSDMYELTDDQQEQVRQQMETIKERQRQYSEPIREEFQSLMREHAELRRSRWEGGQVDESRHDQIEQRMREMRDASPLMNFDNVAGEIEKTLPAEQVASGRERREAFRAEEETRREERRRRWEEMRERWQNERADGEAGDGGPREGGPSGRPPWGPPGAEDGDSDESRESRRDRWRRWREEREQRESEESGQESTAEDQVASASPDESQDDRRDRSSRSELEGDPWDRYVASFIRRYHLDDSQQASAQSLLRTSKEQRDQYRLTSKVDYDAANQIEDSSKQGQEIERLNRPIERIYENLKDRLERIPTADQKARYGDRSSSTSQPSDSGATTRPSWRSRRDRSSDTQPAGDGERDSGRRSRRGSSSQPAE